MADSFTPILVPLDGSALAERAVPYATVLARKLGGRLILVHASTRAIGSGDEARQQAISRLDGIADQARSNGITAETVVDQTSHGEIGRTIIEAVEARGAGLIVMSTHGQGGLGRWLFGSVPDQVLRRAEVPVLLISATCERVWPEPGPRRILVPLDGSKMAEAVLEPAGRLARELEAPLLLLRVVEPASSAFPAFEPPLAFDFDADLAASREYLEELARQLAAEGTEVETRVDLGSPAALITEVAREWQADLIAMATHGRGTVARLVLGSVTTRTLQLAQAPLLLVRSPNAKVGLQVEPGTSGQG